MPSRKPSSKLKPSSPVEVLDAPNPWLVAYKKVYGEELQKDEITVRSFANLVDCSRDKAKKVLEKMVETGVAELVGKKTLSQDGLRPSTVSVYRLTNGKQG